MSQVTFRKHHPWKIPEKSVNVIEFYLDLKYGNHQLYFNLLSHTHVYSLYLERHCRYQKKKKKFYFWVLRWQRQLWKPSLAKFRVNGKKKTNFTSGYQDIDKTSFEKLMSLKIWTSVSLFLDVYCRHKFIYSLL